MDSDSEKRAPLILALDTATDHPSAALLQGVRPLVTRSLSREEQTSATLMETLRSLFDEAGGSIREVDLYAVVNGPGSFTGLRVGLATVKGLAMVHPRPVAAVTSLEATALLAGTSRFTCVLLNGRRNEVFTQAFAVEKEFVTPLDVPLAVPIDERLKQVLPQPDVLFAGDAVSLYRADIEREAQARGMMVAESGESRTGVFQIYTGSLLLAEAAARLALRYRDTGRLGDGSALDACYVRSTDEQLKLKRAFSPA